METLKLTNPVTMRLILRDKKRGKPEKKSYLIRNLILCQNGPKVMIQNQRHSQ